VRSPLFMKLVKITLHWRCTSVDFSMQPTHTPARDGQPGTRAGGQSVGWWSRISQAIQVCRFIHLGDAHSKQWAALITSSVSIPCSVVSAGYWMRYFSSTSGNLLHVVFCLGQFGTKVHETLRTQN